MRIDTFDIALHPKTQAAIEQAFATHAYRGRSMFAQPWKENGVWRLRVSVYDEKGFEAINKALIKQRPRAKG